MKHHLLRWHVFPFFLSLIGLFAPEILDAQSPLPKYYHDHRFPVPDSSTLVAQGIREIRYFPLVKAAYERAQKARAAQKGTFHIRKFDDYSTYAVAKINAAGQLTHFHYYSRFELGWAYEYDYDSLGRRIQYREYDIQTYEFPGDNPIAGNAQVMRLLQPAGIRYKVVNYNYGPGGRLQSVVIPPAAARPGVVTIRYRDHHDSLVPTFDHEGRLQEIVRHRRFTDSLKHAKRKWPITREVFHYDAAGRLAHVDNMRDDSLRYRDTLVYDTLNRLIFRKKTEKWLNSGPSGNITQFAYDDQGRVLWRSDKVPYNTRRRSMKHIYAPDGLLFGLRYTDDKNRVVIVEIDFLNEETDNQP
ncbi:MAG: hypothetical protein AAF570_05845 [Bacteroidota bacterium]